jgi:hypothetical protein
MKKLIQYLMLSILLVAGASAYSGNGFSEDCEAHGFDYGIAGWEYNQTSSAWEAYGDPVWTSVNGSSDVADWQSGYGDGALIFSDAINYTVTGTVGTEHTPGMSLILICAFEGSNTETGSDTANRILSQNDPEIPEYGMYAAIVALLGGVAIYLTRKH